MAMRFICNEKKGNEHSKAEKITKTGFEKRNTVINRNVGVD